MVFDTALTWVVICIQIYWTLSAGLRISVSVAMWEISQWWYHRCHVWSLWNDKHLHWVQLMLQHLQTAADIVKYLLISHFWAEVQFVKTLETYFICMFNNWLFDIPNIVIFQVIFIRFCWTVPWDLCLVWALAELCCLAAWAELKGETDQSTKPSV